MSLSTSTLLSSPRGMHDLLPIQSAHQEYVEHLLASVARNHGFHQIRTPVVEQLDVFKRSVGEATDIIEKEMYMLAQKGKQCLALRPENTAGCVRAFIEHQLRTPQKLYYLGPMFRYERPQSGRYRQFFQFGVEYFGSSFDDESNDYVDMELLQLCCAIWQTFGLYPRLEINYLGTRAERKLYNQALVAFLMQHRQQLDSDSQRRLDTNPLRILDSKQQQTQQLLDKAPQLHDFFGNDSIQNFQNICQGLDLLDITYTHNKRLVRGLDYYSGLVFEWVSDDLGAQATLCGGGRYDTLCSDLGSRHFVAGAGFGIGLERLLLILAKQDNLPKVPALDVALISDGTAMTILGELAHIRKQLPRWRIDAIAGKQIGKKLARAAKSGAEIALIIGKDERATQHIIVKHLHEKKQQFSVSIDTLADHFDPNGPCTSVLRTSVLPFYLR